MEHLIADSGIHFFTTEVEFNPAEPITLPNGRALKYAFCDTTDDLTGERIFDLLCSPKGSDVLIPFTSVKDDSTALTALPDGRLDFDETGTPRLAENLNTVLYPNYKQSDDAVVCISSLESYRVAVTTDEGTDRVPAFDLLKNKWLPMPMFEVGDGGQTTGTPTGWCRVRIELISEQAKTHLCRFRLTWAFDTATAKPEALSELRPCFYNEEESKTFGLCNCVTQLFHFLNVYPEESTAFADYVSSLLGVTDRNASYKYVAYYIYLVQALRLLGASPSVTLYNAEATKPMPVDLVLDIGNSRTCGVLFEEGDFTRAAMLSLRDLTHPERVYEKSFDMRLAFRKADIGGDIVMDEDIFMWRSFVRIGDEAKHLIYRTYEDYGLAERATNYSSPKRYLWDDAPYEGTWEFLTTQDDPTGLRVAHNIHIRGLSDYFEPDGRYAPDGRTNFNVAAHFSRASLMTFVMIEIFQQAIMQINSTAFRQKHGNINRRRHLRSVILTCPTAMPRAEQVKLRQCAEDAMDVIRKTMSLPPVTITPSVASLSVPDDGDDRQRAWSYDEASASQLVYLYAEIAQRYSGEIHKFFDLKGHVRPELAAAGYDEKALTIGTIDIGAGTTDIIINAYERQGHDGSLLTPIPVYYDSFYLAGDDILRTIIQNVVIEGTSHDSTELGSISSALTAHLLQMSIDDIAAIPSVEQNKVYRDNVEAIRRATTPDDRDHLKRIFASNLLHDFFGQDSAMMSASDRRCRVDFNTQISHPMSQFFMECLREHRPVKTYTFDDIFAEARPADYLLDYFAAHFGFRFETLRWQYVPEDIAAIVKNTMEPLMKQLSVIMYAYRCDILVLSGRPTSLDAITELFVKHIPLAPNRLVRLNDYRVGQWFPFADGRGYFYDQKAVVAVGAMVGYMASAEGFNGMMLDFSQMIKQMKSTAHYLGLYNSQQRLVRDVKLTPSVSSATLDIAVFPAFIGCKQLNTPQYQARPLYAIYNNSGRAPLRIRISRSYATDREHLEIEDITHGGDDISRDDVQLRQQSIVDDGRYWLDKGEFELSIVK